MILPVIEENLQYFDYLLGKKICFIDVLLVQEMAQLKTFEHATMDQELLNNPLTTKWLERCKNDLAKKGITIET